MSEKTYAELKKQLKAPIDKKLISYKKTGGANIAFVNITDLKDILDERLTPHYWEASVKQAFVAGDDLVMIVCISISASDGVYSQDGTGVEKLALRGYGDIASNAYAQAFRRACESHGLGRELWRMELSGEQMEIVKESAKPAKTLAERIAGAQKAIREKGGKVEPFDVKGKSDEELQAELATLTEQYKRLVATKENKQ